jgi:hypothetical protein
VEEPKKDTEDNARKEGEGCYSVTEKKLRRQEMKMTEEYSVAAFGQELACKSILTVRQRLGAYCKKPNPLEWR